MPFEITRWKAEIQKHTNEWRIRAQNLGVKSVYASIALTAFLPVFDALQKGLLTPELLPALLGAAGGVAGSVGGNLLAEQLQRRRDKVDTPDEQQQLNQALLKLAEQLQRWSDRVDTPEGSQQFIQALFEDAAKNANFAEVVENVIEGVAVPVLDGTLVPTERGELKREQTLVRQGQMIQVLVQNYFASGATQIVNMHNTQEDERANARQNYLSFLSQRCGELTLPPLSGQEQKNIKLDDVYVTLNTTTMVQPKGEPGKLVLEKEKPLTALDAVQQYTRLAILGDPGGGKSTFVRRLVAKYCIACQQNSPLQEGHPLLIPVFTVLRDMAKALDAVELTGTIEDQQRVLLDVIWTQWRKQLRDLEATAFEKDLQQALKEGNVILIFDGLDEVTTPLRPKIRRLLSTLTTLYPAIYQIIITCRVRSYTGVSQITNYTAVTLAPFTLVQIRTFTTRWYETQARNLPEEVRRSRATDLTNVAVGNLREFAVNPLLLTTMAMIHQTETKLPDERVKLYARTVDLLLARWQQHKGIPVSESLSRLLNSTDKLREIMEGVAYETHLLQSKNRAGDMPRGSLWVLLEKHEYIGVGNAQLIDEFIDYVDKQAGVLVGKGNDEEGRKPPEYTFPHRSLQEYLAGCYMIRGTTKRSKVVADYIQRAEEGDFWQLAAQLGAEEILFGRRDQEKLLELAYKLYPKRVQSAGEWRRVIWCSRMVQVVGGTVVENDVDENGADYFLRLRSDLSALLKTDQLPAIERAEAGRILADLGDLRLEVTNVDAMTFCWVPPGRFWMGSDKRDELSDDDERPDGWYDLHYGYWIGKYPVTNAQFKTFEEEGGYTDKRWWSVAEAAGYWSVAGFKGDFDKEVRNAHVDYGTPYNLSNHPVVGVSWFEVLAYTLWLTERWQKAGYLPMGWQVVLPSEPEWEKASRGGELVISSPFLQTVHKGLEPLLVETAPNFQPYRRYPWGDSPDPEWANYAETRIGTTSAVGSFAAGRTPYGCEEMSGNVLEWQRSEWIDKYPYEADKREDVTLHNKPRVLRGGAFGNNEQSVRCAARNGLYPYPRNRSYGFRVVVVAVSPFPLESEPSAL
jgi:formylglycine-generating enzyme required for sulfatase activity